jgi:6-phosphogluconolactonase
MLGELSKCTIQWDLCHIFQVDERVAPAGSESRNLTHLQKLLIDRIQTKPLSTNTMPVEAENLNAGAEQYSRTLVEVCGQPPELDLVVLGLGSDGHTASLIPGDPVLDSGAKQVGVTGEYGGTKRMTLTAPVLAAARRQLWLVTGKSKAAVLNKFIHGKTELPATRVRNDYATVFTDTAAFPASSTSDERASGTTKKEDRAC